MYEIRLCGFKLISNYREYMRSDNMSQMCSEEIFIFPQTLWVDILVHCFLNF